MSIDLDVFRAGLEKIIGLGPLRDLAARGLIMDPLAGTIDEVDADMAWIVKILDAMTPEERRTPGLIDAEGRRRIAAAAGVTPWDVATLVRRAAALARRGPMTFSEKLRYLTGRGLPRPRELWEEVAAKEADPGEKGPWITIWNRNLLLWELASDG